MSGKRRKNHFSGAVEAQIWLTSGSRSVLRVSQIALKVHLLYVSDTCLPIHDKMNVACYLADSFEYAPLGELGRRVFLELG